MNITFKKTQRKRCDECNIAKKFINNKTEYDRSTSEISTVSPKSTASEVKVVSCQLL